VLHLRKNEVSSSNLCATARDFERYFATERTDLLRLSLHLTWDAETAERCVTLALRDCCFRIGVAKDRVHIWARRMVIRNAIRLIWGTTIDIFSEPGFEFHLQFSDYPVEVLRESIAVLTLPDFDRLAFVICVLERYSILDCALLLRKAPRVVQEAIQRATDQVVSVEERKKHAASYGNAYGAFTDGRTCFESSCGSILDYDC
jgi:hypothetical protein